MHRYGDCSFCGGDVQEERVELDYRYKGKLYVFREVQAGVCQQCGEKYLTAATAKKIEYLIRTKQVYEETLRVPLITLGGAVPA